MVDKLFLKLVYHEQNLKKFQSDVVYFNQVLNIKLGLINLVSKSSNISTKGLPNYKYFKTIQLENIITLRKKLDINNELHSYWCEKIHRFLEYRLSSVKDKIKKNYLNKSDRVIFIQNIITLLLEFYDNTKDARYLSLALKLLRNHSMRKHGFKISNHNVQYAYNILVAYKLTKNL